MASITIKNIPPELHARIKQTASDHRRSINNELIIALEQLFLTGDGAGPTNAEPSDTPPTAVVNGATEKDVDPVVSTEPEVDTRASLEGSHTDNVAEATSAVKPWLLSTPPMTSVYRVKPPK